MKTDSELFREGLQRIISQRSYEELEQELINIKKENEQLKLACYSICNYLIDLQSSLKTTVKSLMEDE